MFPRWTPWSISLHLSFHCMSFGRPVQTNTIMFPLWHGAMLLYYYRKTCFFSYVKHVDVIWCYLLHLSRILMIQFFNCLLYYDYYFTFVKHCLALLYMNNFYNCFIYDSIFTYICFIEVFFCSIFYILIDRILSKMLRLTSAFYCMRLLFNHLAHITFLRDFTCWSTMYKKPDHVTFALHDASVQAGWSHSPFHSLVLLASLHGVRLVTYHLKI